MVKNWLGKRPPPAPDAPFQNRLGMRFVPVRGTSVLFSMWETRNRDYVAYAKANRSVDMSWRNVVWKGVAASPGADHPVVHVSWNDANGFCEWLTCKERWERVIGPDDLFRLPTDLEWSAAVGLTGEAGGTPQERDGKAPGIYPWDGAWPPPPGSGNFCDQTFATQFPDKKSWAIGGYDDGYATTAPVGSFPPNRFGIYDLAGNVWEWCEDSYEPGKESRVLRGGSWIRSDPAILLSSSRLSRDPSQRFANVGFRCVLVVGGLAR